VKYLSTELEQTLEIVSLYLCHLLKDDVSVKFELMTVYFFGSET
jgi:hypothetical protein